MNETPHVSIPSSPGRKVKDATAFVGEIAQRPVEAGPAVGFDFLLQGGADLLSFRGPSSSAFGRSRPGLIYSPLMTRS
jgi:hypothetical protein